MDPDEPLDETPLTDEPSERGPTDVSLGKHDLRFLLSLNLFAYSRSTQIGVKSTAGSVAVSVLSNLGSVQTSVDEFAHYLLIHVDFTGVMWVSGEPEGRCRVCERENVTEIN